MEQPSVPPLSRALTQDAINAYADAAGDHNPIHVDETFARATPFGGTIAHGMLVLAYVSETMTRAFGDAWARTGRLKVRFKAPARPGDTLTVTAEPKGRAVEDSPGREENGQARWEYAVTCANAAGEALITGTASVEAA